MVEKYAKELTEPSFKQLSLQMTLNKAIPYLKDSDMLAVDTVTEYVCCHVVGYDQRVWWMKRAFKS